MGHPVGKKAFPLYFRLIRLSRTRTLIRQWWLADWLASSSHQERSVLVRRTQLTYQAKPYANAVEERLVASKVVYGRRKRHPTL